MIADPIVAEVRRVRKAIEAACGNDPVEYAARMRALEHCHVGRLVQRCPKMAGGARAVAESSVPYCASEDQR